MNVESIMSQNVQVCRRDQTALSALLLMRDHNIGCVPIVNDGKLVGLVTDRDIALGMADANKSPSNLELAQIMTRAVHSVRRNDTIDEAESMMRAHRVRRLPVVDDDNHPIGMLSLDDIARAGETQTWTGDNGISAEGVAATLAATCEPHA
jgi:CBS domain-containing protein